MPQQENAFVQRGAKAPRKPRAIANSAVVGGRHEIDFLDRLNHLDSPQARAYGARDLEGGGGRRFALVLTRNSYGRFAHYDEFNAIDTDGMLRVFSHGPVAAPGAERERMALIVERPAGERVMTRDSKPSDRLDERAVIDQILVPLEDSLRALHRAGLTHRAVRPDNLFFRDLAKRSAGLGECLSAPPGFDQPHAFEPIESAMASPTGRGEGTPASDMFALGATIVTLLSGRWPANTCRPHGIARRIEHGSYRELAGRLNCSHNMEDLLAGLLYDDPEGRWNVDQLRAWLHNKSAGRRPFQRSKSAFRPFMIEELSCGTPRAVAYALSLRGDAARSYLTDGQLTRWLERSLGDIHLADAVTRIIGDGSDDDPVRPKIDDKTVCRLLRLLDPDGPVYFRGAAVMLDGFGHAIAEAILSGDGEAEKVLETVLANALPVERLPEGLSRARRQRIEGRFRIYQGFVRGSAPGIGIERCFYEMNPGIPCQSALLRGHTVRSLDELLPALNRVAAGGEVPGGRPRDAHIGAFLATHMPVPEQQRAANEVARAAPGSQDCIHDLAHLARVQRLCGHGRLRNLARWLGADLQPAIQGHYSRSRRRRLAARMSAVINSGNLSELLSLVNDHHEQAIDREEYARAVAGHTHHTRMMAHIQTQYAARRVIARSRGRRAAFVVGCVVLLVSCVAALGGGLP